MLQWVQHIPIAPQIGERLSGYANTNRQLALRLSVGLFPANSLGFIDCSQPLLDHDSRDDKVTTSFRVKGNVSRFPHRIHAATDSDQRGDRALAALQQEFIIPIRTSSLTYGRFGIRGVDYPAGHATYLRISKARNN